MIRKYDDLTPEEKDQLAAAWRQIKHELYVYEKITGATDLPNIVYDEIWRIIEYAKEEEL